MGKALDGRNLGKGITQRKDGRYYARIRSNGKLIEMYDMNLEYLRARLNTVKVDNRCTSIGRGFTVEEWFEEWFDLYKAPVIKETSIAPMKNRVRNTILPYIGKKPLAELTNLEFQRVVSRLIIQNKISRSSIREAARRLDECFAAAVNNGLIPRNPAFGAAVPLDEKDVRERRFLSGDEIRVFLEEARDTWWYEMLYCMMHTGMRIGEISALCWSDIDWTNKRIKVRKNLATWYENGTKHESLTSPKTTNAYRVIPFMAEVETQLRSQKAKVDSLKKTLGPRFRSTGDMADLVFVTSMGSPCNRYNAEKAITRIVNQINEKESVRAAMEGRAPVLFERCYPHALRHTFASICFKAGMNPKVVQKLMGHANYATTIDTYTHIMADTMDMDVDKFNALMLES